MLVFTTVFYSSLVFVAGLIKSWLLRVTTSCIHIEHILVLVFTPVFYTFQVFTPVFYSSLVFMTGLIKSWYLRVTTSYIHIEHILVLVFTPVFYTSLVFTPIFYSSLVFMTGLIKSWLLRVTTSYIHIEHILVLVFTPVFYTSLVFTPVFYSSLVFMTGLIKSWLLRVNLIIRSIAWNQQTNYAMFLISLGGGNKSGWVCTPHKWLGYAKNVIPIQSALFPPCCLRDKQAEDFKIIYIVLARIGMRFT